MLGFGTIHDIGKFHPDFQRYIKNPKEKQGVDHSSAGAVLSDPKMGPILAYPIAGHHVGLDDHNISLTHPGVREVGIKMLPSLFGFAVYQINISFNFSKFLNFALLFDEKKLKKMIYLADKKNREWLFFQLLRFLKNCIPL